MSLDNSQNNYDKKSTKGKDIKKIIKWLIALTVLAVFSGCTGIITGHEYSKKDLVIVYKVVKGGGVTTFMTPEQIQDAKLKKVDVVVTDSYKIITAEEAAATVTDTNTTNVDTNVTGSDQGKPLNFPDNNTSKTGK